MKLGKIIYIAVIVILVAVFAFSAFYVGSYFYEANQQQSEYDDLAAIVESIQGGSNRENTVVPTNPATPGETDDTPEGSETEAPKELVILPEYLALYEMNPDIVGWLKIEGTKINYPVMQSPEEEANFYLDHNFNRAKSSRGCIYIREVCDVFAPSDNLTLYGHNMIDGSMFAGLREYQRQAYWKNHDTIIFDTLSEYHTYRIFAVFKTTASVGKGFAYHRFVDAADEAEFNDFVATCKELSFYDTGITPVYGDKLICLSTCEYSQSNGRFVVVAVRVS